MAPFTSQPDFKSRRPNSAFSPAHSPELPHAFRQFYDALYTALGPQHWWPGRTPFEVIIGAILTQNTSWANVQRAMANLRKAKLLTPGAMEKVSRPRLAKLVRPSGYFRQKARKLKAFIRFLRREYGGSLARMFRTPVGELREKLLAVHGIGPETADSILLYAGQQPAFVVDAYTRRILERHGHAAPRDSYEQIRARFESVLPRDAHLYNEYHALIVHTGKSWCRTKNPRCDECPLAPFLPDRIRTESAPELGFFAEPVASLGVR